MIGCVKVKEFNSFKCQNAAYFLLKMLPNDCLTLALKCCKQPKSKYLS